MSKKFTAVCAIFLLLFPTFSVAQSKKVAFRRFTLPEFRDISIWKLRTGLTLFSPGGKYLAVSGKSADVVVYDLQNGEIKTKIDGTGFRAFSFSPDEKFAIAQNTSDLSMQIFDIENGKPVRAIRGLGKLSGVNKLFGGSGIVNELHGILPLVVLEMGRVPVTRNWKSILVNKNDKEFALVDFETGELRYELKHENFNSGWEGAKLAFAFLGAAAGAGTAGFMLLGSQSNAQFSSNGKYLLIANGNKKPTLWEVESGKLISKFDAGSRVFYTKFSPDESMVATSDYEGITKIWNTATGELISTIGSKKERGVIAGWNNAGTKVLINPMKKGDLRSYDARTGALVVSFQGSMPNGTLLSSDSNVLVTLPRKNKTILFQVWETETGKLLASVPRVKKQDAVMSIKWSPNNRMIATAEGIKKEVKLWDLQGNNLQILENSTMPMTFSDDGRFLATGGIVPATKADLGYLWEFPTNESDERLGD